MTELTADLRRILTECRTIAVVGLSAKEHRASHQVARYLQQHGYRIVPVHPGLASVLGEPCYARLTDIPHAVDLVNVFRRTEDVLPVAQEAVAIGARCLWQQLGIIAVLLLTSKGAAGVTGSGFIVLAATLSSVGHIPVASIALILGVDRFMSEARALTNLVGNGVATVVVAKWENSLDEDRMRRVLDHETEVDAAAPESELPPPEPLIPPTRAA